MWVHLAIPPTSPFSQDKSKFEQVPYLEMKTADDKFVPWQPSQTDILATDWERA